MVWKFGSKTLLRGRVTGKSLMTGQIPTEILEGNNSIDPKQSTTSSSVSSDSEALNASSRNMHEGEDSFEHADEIKEFQHKLEYSWEKRSDSLLCDDGPSSEECSPNFKNMLADKGQLLRILVARKFSLEDSEKLFFEQLRFRLRWKPEEIGPKDIPNALPSGAWRLAGHTKDGLVVSNYKLRYWEPQKYGVGEKNLDNAVLEYTKYIVYVIEAMIARMDELPAPQKFVVLFDLRGFTPSLVFRKDVRLMIRKLIYVAQAQYPERLHRTLLVNAPFGFESAWKLIKPLLDEKTATKIHFVKEKSIQDEIDADVLSKEYGGNHEEYPIDF